MNRSKHSPRQGHRASHPPHRRKGIKADEPAPAADFSGICGVCGCGGYRSRKAAKRSARRRYPGAHMREYECPGGTGLWHFGPVRKRREAA